MKKKIRITEIQKLAVGFIAIILVGAILLCLPAANRGGESPGFFNALFTAVSATCVTGLVVVDTWTQFNLFGQIVLLTLIQVGGLGFITIGMCFSLFLGEKIGLRERSLLMESISSPNIGGVVELVKHALIGTAIFEGAGAVLLSIRFSHYMDIEKGIWYGIFHSVSAFCNAGFDLMGCFEEYSSMVYFQSDVFINAVLMLLIITGGIGFLVWQDFRINKLRFSKYMLHTKLMLIATAFLILVPAAAFFFTERDTALEGMNVGERILSSLFLSVSARTAGFNTVDLSQLSGGGNLLMYLLMIIGAGAGSTAGGIKVTTFVIMLLFVIAFCRGRKDVVVFWKKIDEGQMRRAFSASLYFLIISFLGAFVIMVSQPLPIKDVLFEVFSATGTVGITTGITRELNTISRIVIMLLMYSGRMGSITVAMAVAGDNNSSGIESPTERIIIG